MIVKHKEDHNVVQTEFCDEIQEILGNDEYSPNIALAINIRDTIGHYHEGFDEIYFVLDGSLTLELYNPAENKTVEQILNANELCVITKGVHHKIIKASEENRLCLITIPKFNIEDEIRSDMI